MRWPSLVSTRSRQADTDVKISRRKFIWTLLEKGREENRIGQREELNIDTVSRKTTVVPHRELWTYGGLPVWSQVVTKRAILLYSHIDQGLDVGYLWGNTYGPARGRLWGLAAGSPPSFWGGGVNSSGLKGDLSVYSRIPPISYSMYFKNNIFLARNSSEMPYKINFGVSLLAAF